MCRRPESVSKTFFWQAIYHPAQAAAESSNLEEIIQGGAPQAEGFRARIAADVMERAPHYLPITVIGMSYPGVNQLLPWAYLSDHCSSTSMQSLPLIQALLIFL